MGDSDFEVDWSAPEEEEQHTETQTETKRRTILKPSPHIVAKVEAQKRRSQMCIRIRTTPAKWKTLTAFDEYVWRTLKKAMAKVEGPRDGISRHA